MPQLIHPNNRKSRCFQPLAVIAPLIIALSLAPATSLARTLKVGPGEEFALPSIAAQFAEDGDVVEIAAGIYFADAATWTQNDLVISGIGGRAVLDSAGAHAKGKGIWVISGNNVTIQAIEFVGARVPHGNGAGIRMQGGDLTIENCVFRDNQNGILAYNNPDSTLVVRNSEFDHNGAGRGHTHNMYIGKIRSFTLTGSYSHHARVGHNVKTRALENHITYNRIMDEQNGTSSYGIDLPHGGIAYIIGNVIQQGASTENSNIISFGAEGYRAPRNELYFINNTVVNDRIKGGNFFKIKPGNQKQVFMNNLFVGKGNLIKSAQSAGNLYRPSEPFQQRMRFNYRLEANSAAINTGMDPGTANGVNLTPTREYRHKAKSEPRQNKGTLDIGAFEYRKP